MTYSFDPELAPVVAMLPGLDLSDIPAARAMMGELMVGLGAPDATGVQVEDVRIPGPDGAPDAPLRIYRPDTVAAPAAVYDVHGAGSSSVTSTPPTPATLTSPARSVCGGVGRLPAGP